MPRYFFHIQDGVTAQDDEGVELEDVSVAKCQAVRLAGQMICDDAASFWDREEWKLTATDEAGLTLFCLHIVGIDAPAAMAGRDRNLISAHPIRE
jgi:hypothetical protein